MFLGRTDEARMIYLQYRGATNVHNGKEWEALVLEEFAQLHEAGLMHALMKEIEQKFSGQG